MVKIIQCWIIGLDKRKYHASDKSNAVIEGYDNIPRQKQNHVDGNKSKETFRDLRGTFAEEQVKKET